ncbi:hypothetical protein Tco_0128087 [Tanacetum coccineum]
MLWNPINNTGETVVPEKHGFRKTFIMATLTLSRNRRLLLHVRGRALNHVNESSDLGLANANQSPGATKAK